LFKKKHERLFIKVKYFVRDLTGVAAICGSTNSIRDVYWDRGFVQWELHNGCLSCCDGKYMYRVCPKVPSKKWFEGKMVLSCPPQLSWEGKRGEHLGHIYLHDGDVE